MLQHTATIKKHSMTMRRQRPDHRAVDVPIAKVDPSNGGDRVYEGGFGPAPSKVITVPNWRALGCAGAALAMSRAARRRAAEMVKIFIAEG